MNYYGRSLAEADAGTDLESAAMGDILHAALMQPSHEAPYRGPASLKKGDCEHQCTWEGSPEDFHGEEEILRTGKRIYFLRFHGGIVS
jgi:hypothetical protein